MVKVVPILEKNAGGFPGFFPAVKYPIKIMINQ
jgi:hypothetical protein